MRIAILLTGLIIYAASCTPHRTCPTYLKKDVKPVIQEKVKV